MKTLSQILKESKGSDHTLASAQEGFDKKHYISLGELVLSGSKFSISNDSEKYSEKPGATPEKYTELSDGYGIFWSTTYKYYYTVKLDNEVRKYLGKYLESRKVDSFKMEVPEDVTVTVAELEEKLQEYVDRGYIIKVYDAFKWGRIVRRYSNDIVINPQRRGYFNSAFETNVENFCKTVRAYYKPEDKIKIHCNALKEKDKKTPFAILAGINLSGLKASSTVNTYKDNKNFILTPEDVKPLSDFIENRDVEVKFESGYSFTTDTYTPAEIKKTLKEWAERQRPPKMYVIKEPADYMQNKEKYCSITVSIRNDLDKELMRPEAAEDLNKHQKSVDKAMSNIYGRGSGNWTGD